MNHEDDWFVVATILGRDIGMKGSVWRYDPLALRQGFAPRNWAGLVSVTCALAAYAQANQALNSEVTPQARLVSTLSQFGPARIWVTGRGVEAGYRIAGQVTVAVNPF